MQKIKGGFTLVELIVTITILVILWTISFIAVQRYTKDSRDSVRISDIANIQQALGVYIVAVWQYPTPSNGVNITYSGWTVWTQWSVWDNVIKNLWRLNKKPVDPRYGIEYSYSVTGFKKEYVIWGVMESLGVAQLSPDLIPQVMADNETAILRWNYNEKIVQVSTGGVDYILALPSILSSDVSVLDVNDIIANKKLVYNNYSNLPSSDTSIATFQKSWGFNYTPSKVVVFSGNIASLSTVEGMRLFIHNLQDAYSGTILWNIAGYKSLLEVNDANIDAYGSNFIAWIPQFPKDLRMGIGVISTDGICGSSDGQGFTSTPSTNLCSAWNTGSVSGSGPWTWSCNTLNGGINANCSALLAVDGVCGSSNGQSFWSTPSTNLCSAWNTGSLSGSGPWSWSCNGLNGGTNARCSVLRWL